MGTSTICSSIRCCKLSCATNLTTIPSKNLTHQQYVRHSLPRPSPMHRKIHPLRYLVFDALHKWGSPERGTPISTTSTTCGPCKTCTNGDSSAREPHHSSSEFAHYLAQIFHFLQHRWFAIVRKTAKQPRIAPLLRVSHTCCVLVFRHGNGPVQNLV